MSTIHEIRKNNIEEDDYFLFIKNDDICDINCVMVLIFGILSIVYL